MNLSKSLYTQGITCEKKLWLSCFKPDEADNSFNQAVVDNGNMVGEYARGLFGDYVLIEYSKNKQKMVDGTKKELEKNTKVICEASFIYDGNYCAVDILRNYKDGVEIYEVKSSTDFDSIYLDDISYQTYVLKKCGLNVKKSFIVYVNSKYIKNGELDINKYFNIEDVTGLLSISNIEDNINDLKKVINSKKEPDIDLSMACHFNSTDCPFFKYCTKKLPKPNVFDIGWNMRFDKKLDIYYRNNISFEDILRNEKLNDKPFNQVMVELDNRKIINRGVIKKFLSDFKYPLYFLDFESYQDAIPKIDGTRPYQQICFQYSLHIMDKNGKLEHKEFLNDDYNGNPMYKLCERLCEDIPQNSCVIVYNQKFEKTRLSEMSLLFPEFSKHLLNISDNIIDLMIPFFNQDYYVKTMVGSYSIKKVLPALFPNDPSLDYNNLEQVHKGDEASSSYLSLRELNKEEETKLRNSLLRYCELDTLAMVRIYEFLRDL